DQGPDAHDAAPHFVGDNRLEDGIRGREIQDEAEPDEREQNHPEIEISRVSEENERDRENPDAAERHCPGWQYVPGTGDGEGGDQRPDAASGHEQTIAVCLEVKNIVRERREQDRIRPAEYADDGE